MTSPKHQHTEPAVDLRQMLMVVPGSLLCGDGMGQRPDHCRDDVGIHQFLTDPTLIAIRLVERLERLPAPVLSYRKVNANWGFGKLTGADLVGVGTCFNAEPALQAAALVKRHHERRLVVD